MLSKLYIENVAVIESLTFEPGEGFSVLTGETGAGKSVIIDSINLILGERSSKDLIRTGASCAYVSALFSRLDDSVCAALRDFGVEADSNGEFFVERELGDSRSSCRINGRPATVALLKDISKLLINIHGQHDNQSLLQPERHIDFLDRFADIGDLLVDYKKIHTAVKDTKNRLKAVLADESAKQSELETIDYEIGEIEAAKLTDGEDDRLLLKRNLLKNAEKVITAVTGAYNAVYGGEASASASELVSSAAASLETIKDVSPEVAQLHARLSDISYSLSDCVDTLRDIKDGCDFDSGLQEEIEERLDLIYRLKSKYGKSCAEILHYCEQLKERRCAIQDNEQTAALLKEKLDDEASLLKQMASKLTEARTKAAGLLQKSITEELAFLDMSKVSFVVDIKKNVNGEKQVYGSIGSDVVEFLISTNQGEPEKPLSKIASGGELSRIMLAMKAVLSKGDAATLIFDEIDTGVSGRAAEKIGRKMQAIAKGRQVLSVTHLSQIAALADNHFLISKKADDGRVKTSVALLDFEGRKQELARIISGEKISDIALRNAHEMLYNANKPLEDNI